MELTKIASPDFVIRIPARTSSSPQLVKVAYRRMSICVEIRNVGSLLESCCRRVWSFGFGLLLCLRLFCSFLEVT